MDNREIAFEKRIRVEIGVFVVVYLLLIYNLASSMSVLPAFLEENIAHAPTREPIAAFDSLQ